MSFTTNYDVIIIGAGPSGSAAGKVLAEAGAKVLIAEKSILPRNKVCGGMITEKTYRLLKTRLNLLDIDTAIIDNASGFEMYNKLEILNSIRSDKHLYFCSRQVFDHYLALEARAAGCNLSDNAFVKCIDNHHLIINGTTVTFDYLIGADGVNSATRKHIAKSLNVKYLALGLQIEIPRHMVKGLFDIVLPRIYLGYIPYGWGWVFPKGDYLSIGIGGLSYRSKRLQHAFNNFLGDLGVLNILGVVKPLGALLPYGTYLETPATNNILLTGDAAGFVECLNGEGIYFALLSGILAAESIMGCGANKGVEYIKKCKSKIIPILRQSYLARNIFFPTPFISIAQNRFRHSSRYMESFMSLLSGDIDYISYFWKLLFGRKQ